jgi:hypothetical protein
MIKRLPGVTHIIVVVPLKGEADITKVHAYVDLYFGPGDDNSISGIRYVKREGKFFWESPMYVSLEAGQKVHLPIFRGSILKEISELASAAISKVKRQFGRSTFGTRYRVLETEVLIEPPVQ